jgi:dolichyl-phosphate-mannose--protein O-mannosyl transferase
LVGIGVLLAWDAAWRRRDGILGLAGHPAATVAVGVLLGGVVPLAVYVATYAPYLGLGHTFAELARLQESMYSYHAHLDATHPYSSPWYGWPIGRSPVFLYLSDGVRGQAEIWTAGNPVVFLGGLFGLVAISVRAFKRRTAALAVPVLAALVQYLPWVFVGRVLFLYHYLPVVPFLCLGLGWWVAVGREPRSEKRRRIEVAVTLGAALVAFAVLLPLVDGWMVPEGYLKAVKDGLFAWMWRR